MHYINQSDKVKKNLIISAHADDETFGMGGTALKLRGGEFGCRFAEAFHLLRMVR